jgi:hypothetical protein
MNVIKMEAFPRWSRPESPVLTSRVIGLSRTLDDSDQPAGDEALQFASGFVPELGRTPAVVIESAGEPVISTVSSEQFGTRHASVHSAAAPVVFLPFSRIDAATLIPEFVRPWGRNTQRVRDHTHANSTMEFGGGRFWRGGVGFVRMKINVIVDSLRFCRRKTHPPESLR